MSQTKINSSSPEVTLGGKVAIGAGNRLLLIAGPCQIESKEHCLKIASRLQEICARYPINLVFKSSFDKANRTSLSGKRGPGLDHGLKVLEAVKKETGLLVLSDVHTPEQAPIVAEVVDLLQTPAFLCRQTDLLLAVGATGKPVNVKKGQFLHPEDMKFTAEKIASTGNTKILLCERGTSFGYRDLVVDPRSFVIMSQLGYPVVFDATHSVQLIGGGSGQSSGQSKFIPALVRAAVAVGVDGLFIECHDNPAQAPSDGPSMLPLEQMEEVIKMACAIRDARN